MSSLTKNLLFSVFIVHCLVRLVCGCAGVRSWCAGIHGYDGFRGRVNNSAVIMQAKKQHQQSNLHHPIKDKGSEYNLVSLSLLSRSALHLQHDVDKTTRRNKREANKKSVNKQRIGAGVSYVEYLLPSFHRQRLEYVVLTR